MVALSRSSEERTVGLPVISSRGSEDGLTPSSSQAGIQLEMSGLGAALVSLSVRPRGVLPRVSETSVTCGQSGESLSPSTVLQLSLESRLRANLGVNGSLESELTWRSWDMRSGPQICALRASTRLTAGSGFTGWPTPDTVAIWDGTDFETQRQNLLTRRERTRKAVKEGKTKAGSGRSMSLQMAAQSTQASGMTTTSPNAEPLTELSNTGVLNPDFSRWLMGYPADYAQGLSKDTGTR